ncbi:MAG: aminotransferase class V-fold PLP-dependent enzyme, partial [Vulcanimicrobiaceae bacterium]
MARPEIAAGVQPAPLARHEFEVAPDLIYLNHAAVGVLPRRTRLAVDEFVRAQARRGGLGVAPFEAQIDAARERVARLVGGRADRIAFLRNTSDGANVIARGLDWQPGDEIVVSDNEFGANVRPWLALREHGVVIRFVPTAHERLTPTVLARMLSARTRVIAVSWVGFLDGYRHDLAGLAAVAHDGGAWLCVDAIQGLGVLPCDVEALGVDALYAGTGKWLLGLAGLGLLYLRDDLQAVVQPRWRGWRDVADI